MVFNANMKWIAMAVLFVVHPVLSDTKTTRQLSASPMLAETVKAPTAKRVQMTLGPAMGIFMDSGETGWGTQLGVLARVSSHPVYVGADFGLLFWGSSMSDPGGMRVGIGNDQNSTGLQLLPTVLYQFDISSVVHPYGGLSAGPYLMFGRRTDLDFALLFRPGFNFTFSDVVGINVETKFGQLLNEFAFLPNLSILVTL